MSDRKPYGLTSPCSNCPFRTDVKPYLTPARVREIDRSLERSEFSCHKTTQHDEDGEPLRSRDEMHCAGALILLEKEGRSSQMTRIASRLGMYDPSKLNMAAPTYDSFKEMVAAQEPRKARTPAKKRSRP